MTTINRRQLLYSTGAFAAIALAGCPEEEPEPTPTPTPTPEPGTPEFRVDEFLIEHDANLYDGTIADLTGEEDVIIEVGAGPEGLAYDPAAARIDVGVEVIWEWTGEGGAHNVVSEAADDSDYEYSSGDLVSEAGHTWEYTFEEDGVALYYCQAHRAVGHLGALIVE